MNKQKFLLKQSWETRRGEISQPATTVCSTRANTHLSWRGLSKWKTMVGLFPLALPTSFSLLQKCSSLAMGVLTCGLSWLQTTNFTSLFTPKEIYLC